MTTGRLQKGNCNSFAIASCCANRPLSKPAILPKSIVAFDAFRTRPGRAEIAAL